MVNKTLTYWGSAFEEDLININVGGLRRRLSPSALSKFPDTRLGRLLSCDSEESILQLCDDYDVSAREFYFDRNPGFFLYVLHFYQTGKLHVMEELCVFSFCQEIEYWGINEFFLDSCCSYRYHERKLEGRHPVSYTHLDVYKRQECHFSGTPSQLQPGWAQTDLMQQLGTLGLTGHVNDNTVLIMI
ncbi:UNVERIFIED_CONTAM: hypothetical protein H355_006210 [Colinus virginianus]|nr:hypothetical protein H355_006210 [Colinus virginianus]